MCWFVWNTHFQISLDHKNHYCYVWKPVLVSLRPTLSIVIHSERWHKKKDCFKIFHTILKTGAPFVNSRGELMWSLLPCFVLGSEEQRHVLCPGDWRLLAVIRHFRWPLGPKAAGEEGEGSQPAQGGMLVLEFYTKAGWGLLRCLSSVPQCWKAWIPLSSLNGQRGDLLPP